MSSPYPHPPQVMTDDEIRQWALCFRDMRKANVNLDTERPIPLWKVEGMIATIESLRTSGTLATRPNAPIEVPEVPK